MQFNSSCENVDTGNKTTAHESEAIYAVAIQNMWSSVDWSYDEEKCVVNMVEQNSKSWGR
jgi:hypothetical protein